MSEKVVKGTFDEMCFFPVICIYCLYPFMFFIHNIYISYMSWKFFPDTSHFFFNLLNVSVQCQSPGQYIYQHWRVVTSPQKGIYYVLYIKCIYIYMYFLIREVLRIYIYIYTCSSGSTSILFILRHPCHFKALNVLLTKLGIGPVFMPWELQYLKLHQCSHPCHKNLADWYQDLFPMSKREGAESEPRSSGTGTLVGIFKLELLNLND